MNLVTDYTRGKRVWHSTWGAGTITGTALMQVRSMRFGAHRFALQVGVQFDDQHRNCSADSLDLYGVAS